MDSITRLPFFCEWWRGLKVPNEWDNYKDRLSSASVEIADALLQELSKTPNP